MKKISLILMLTLALFFSGCSSASTIGPNNHAQDTTVIADELLLVDEMNSEYYQEGLRLLDLYCSEEAINDTYGKVKDYPRSELLNGPISIETMHMLENIAAEYQGRATNATEKLFAEKIGSVVIESVMIPISLYNRAEAARNNNENKVSAFTEEINDFYLSVGLLKMATTVSVVQNIETRYTPK